MSKVIEAGEKALGYNKHLNKVYVSPDGIAFISENAAKNHCSSNNLAGEVTEVTRTGIVKTKTDGGGSNEDEKLSAAQQAKAMINQVNELDDIAAIEELTEGVTWKSVKKAVTARIAELKAAEQVKADPEAIKKKLADQLKVSALKEACETLELTLSGDEKEADLVELIVANASPEFINELLD